MNHVTKIACIVVAATAGIVGCNSLIDDPSSPKVVMEVENVTIPPITATVDGTTNTCTFNITAGTATFKDKPKNGQAIVSPFNDIILQGVDIAYVWDDALAMPNGQLGIAGSVPANGSSQAQFYAITGAALTTNARDGHSANLHMTFHGDTVNGDSVSVTTGGMLVVNSCSTQPVGACCTQGGGCNIVSQTSCVGLGGVYQGDNSNCLTVVCP